MHQETAWSRYGIRIPRARGTRIYENAIKAFRADVDGNFHATPYCCAPNNKDCKSSGTYQFF